jgi:predicted regulator of Ras-like GTPase activity (Roadblock/LC7/MglB family)
MNSFIDKKMAYFQAPDDLEHALKELNQRSGDMIEASTIVSNDGLIKAKAFQADIDPHRFGAICASLFSLAKRAAHDSLRGNLRLILIEGDLGTMIVIQLGSKAILAVASKPKAPIGRVLLEVRKTAESVQKYL